MLLGWGKNNISNYCASLILSIITIYFKVRDYFRCMLGNVTRSADFMHESIINILSMQFYFARGRGVISFSREARQIYFNFIYLPILGKRKANATS